MCDRRISQRAFKHLSLKASEVNVGFPPAVSVSFVFLPFYSREREKKAIQMSPERWDANLTFAAGMSKSEDLFDWSLSNRMMYSASRHESILTIFKWKRRSSADRPMWIRRWASDISLAVTIAKLATVSSPYTSELKTYIAVELRRPENVQWVPLYRIDWRKRISRWSAQRGNGLLRGNAVEEWKYLEQFSGFSNTGDIWKREREVSLSSLHDRKTYFANACWYRPDQVRFVHSKSQRRVVSPDLQTDLAHRTLSSRSVPPRYSAQTFFRTLF